MNKCIGTYTHLRVSNIAMWAVGAFCDLRDRFIWYVFRLGRSVTMFVYIPARVVICNACIWMNACIGAHMHFRSRTSRCGPLTRSATCGIALSGMYLGWVGVLLCLCTFQHVLPFEMHAFACVRDAFPRVHMAGLVASRSRSRRYTWTS